MFGRPRPRGRCPRAPAKGTRPFGIPSFGGYGWGETKSLPRWYCLRRRSPACPFFRKEKIHPSRRRRNYDAECFEHVLLRSCILQGAALRHARNQSLLPSAPLPALPLRQVGFPASRVCTVFLCSNGAADGLIIPPAAPDFNSRADYFRCQTHMKNRSRQKGRKALRRRYCPPYPPKTGIQGEPAPLGRRLTGLDPWTASSRS